MLIKTAIRPVLTIILASIVFSFTLAIALFTNVDAKISVLGQPDEPIPGVILAALSKTKGEIKKGEWTYCDYTLPENPEYKFELKGVEVSTDIDSGEKFSVTATYQNLSNTRVFSYKSACAKKPVLNWGTQKTMDRSSTFGSSKTRVSGWISPRRVQMKEHYADPGQTFSFVFESTAPEGNDIYREFFQPVVENVGWFLEPVAADISVGEPSESMLSNIDFVSDLSLAASSLEGLQRNIEIELANQTLFARFGEQRVWSMKISSGASDTPTPRGNYKVLNKQDLRIGGKWPHYHMPYWLGWRKDGYGMHALPYLASDGGTFWQEALTHIGIPVSHGCVRMLPDDARKLYDFASVGTPLNIH